MDRRMSLYLDGHLWAGAKYLGKREAGPVQPIYSVAYRQGHMKEFATVLTVDAIFSGPRSSVVLNDCQAGFDIMSHPVLLVTLDENDCPAQLIATTAGFLRGRKVRVPGARCYILWVGEAQGSPFSGSCWNVYTIPATEKIRVMDFIRRVSVYSDDVTVVTDDDFPEPDEAPAKLREAGLASFIFFDDGKHKRIRYDAAKPNPRIILVKGKSLGVTFDGTFSFRTQGENILVRLEQEFNFIDAEKGWNTMQNTLLVSSFAVPAVSSVAVAVIPYLTQATKKEIESRFASRLKRRLGVPDRASTRLTCTALGLPSPMGLLLTECLMVFLKGVAAGEWPFYEDELDIPYVTPSPSMRGAPAPTQTQASQDPMAVEGAEKEEEEDEESLPIWERMWRRDVLRPEELEVDCPVPAEVDGTEEEIPDSEREEMFRNPLWDYCAEPWSHRLNRIALGRGLKRIAEVAAKSLDFGRKYWRGVRMEVHTMDDMAHMLMLPKISEMKDREQIDKARESVSLFNEYKARLDLLDASTIVVATDGGADPEASAGSGGGATWFLSEDPETEVPTPIWASCCGVVSDIPGADPDSFDGEGFALVHHCAEMKRNLPAEALATVKRFVFYVDANGLLQALKAFNDQSSPLVIQIVRSLEDLEEVCAPGVVFEFRWTPGHAGNPFNDFADYMATRGLDHATGDERGRAVYKKILTAPILRRIVRETVASIYEKSSAHPALGHRSHVLGPYRPRTYVPPFVDRVLFQAWLGCPYPGQLGMASVVHGDVEKGKLPEMTCPFCGDKVVPSCDHFLYACTRTGHGALAPLREEIYPESLGTTIEDRAIFLKNNPGKILKFLAKASKAIPRGVLPPSVGDKQLDYFTEEDAKAEKTPIRFTTFKPEKKKVKDVATWDIVEAKARWISEHM
eukprot:g19246.t1